MTGRLFSASATDPGLKFALLIRDIDQALTRRSAPDLADVGLSRAQIRVLAAIGDVPGSTGGEIAEATNTTPQAVSQVLCRLVDAGLVRRESLGGRAMGHHLTDQGESATYAAREKFGNLTARFLTSLPSDDRDRLIADLETVLRAMTDDDLHE